MVQYRIKGMECSACSARLEKVISNLDGVESCSVNLLSEIMVVEGPADSEEILEAVRKAGFDGELKTSRENNSESEKEKNGKIKLELILSVILVLILMYFSMGYKLGLPGPDGVAVTGLIQAILALAVMVINRRFFVSGIKAAVTGSPNMDTLVSFGSGVSFLYSLAMLVMVAMGRKESADLYFDSAAMILTFVTIGKLLESRSRLKTTDAVHGLMKLIPRNTDVLRNGEEVNIPTEELKKGDLVVIRPGCVIPADGHVTEGAGSVDESSLTGESIPIEKESENEVFAGTVNTAGYFVYRAEKTGDETTVSGIIRLIEETGATKAPIAKSADKAAAVFVPAVLAIAAVTFLVRFILSKDLSFAVNGAISVIVVSCPCSLGLATPVAITVGSGIGAKLGILYKSAAVLEESGRISNIIFDKTGTVTEGKLEVTDFVCTTDETAVLKYAYALENCSEHPIADAISRYARERKTETLQIDNFESVPGRGLTGTCDGRRIQAGNIHIIEDTARIDERLRSKAEEFSGAGQTVIYVTVGNNPVAVFSVADKMRKESAEVIDILRKLGKRVYLLTGDNKSTAERVAAELGIEEVYSEVMPDEKAGIVREIQKTGKTMMVGDGINDAPALVAADVGVAVGNGTDIAVGSADVLLTGNGLEGVVNAVRLGKAVITNIRENLFWAFIYNSVSIPLAAGAFYAAFGLQLNPMICAAAMSLSSICVVTNSLRLNRFNPTKTGQKEGNPDINPDF